MHQPDVCVGIVHARKIRFSLNTPYLFQGERVEGVSQEVTVSNGKIAWNGNLYEDVLLETDTRSAVKGETPSFTIEDVTIGKHFHWERKEAQTFSHSLHFIVSGDELCAVNRLPVEDYLVSVISSEMSASASLQFLKAHAVISRSWLLAQMEKRQRLLQGNGVEMQSACVQTDEEIMKWYDREDHTLYDVCADDHCQRYQGITRVSNPVVVQAVAQTRGQVLLYDGEICDARFSKCCGGHTEEFETCWEPVHKPYLVSLPDPFCETRDEDILRQVLTNYDQETRDFYRWTVTYTQAQLRRLIEKNLQMDLGDILDLVPLSRGKSGRIFRLKIVGTKRQIVIGKELEIRRVLSDSHLFSSAFTVERKGTDAGQTPATFVLHGSGWGHGVGLCQIGAAVMGEKGYMYDQILLHYYPGTKIRARY